jgi:hypothetical protein
VRLVVTLTLWFSVAFSYYGLVREPAPKEGLSFHFWSFFRALCCFISGTFRSSAAGASEREPAGRRVHEQCDCLGGKQKAALFLPTWFSNH